MTRLRPLLALLLLMSVLFVLALFVDDNLRQIKAGEADSVVDPYVQMAVLEKDLNHALEILQEAFGAPVELKSIRTTKVTLTAYSSTRDQCDATPHITASNTSVRRGVVAVSQDLIEELGLHFGQRVLIPGHGIFEVQDKMNSRWRRRVDIWHGDKEAARLFGKKKGTLIWVVTEAAPEVKQKVSKVETPPQG